MLGGSSEEHCPSDLIGDDVFSLRALLPLGHFHSDFLAFLQSLEAFHLNSGVMHKNIVPTFTFNKTKTLVIVEPFDGSCYSFT